MNKLSDLIEKLEHNVGIGLTCLSSEEIGQLLEAARELQIYREGGVTEELLRRNNGCIKVGKGCMIVAAGEQPCQTK